MPEESLKTQNLDQVSVSTATQEPTPEAPLSLSTSEQASMPPVAPESPGEADSAVLVNNLSYAEAVVDSNKAEIPLVPVTPVSSLVTAQIPAIEPLAKLSLLAKAREMIQFRKRKKLNKIMDQFLKQATMTNDEVEKLLHVSDATATRYLEQLEKEGKIKQTGRTGKSVSYSRII